MFFAGREWQQFEIQHRFAPAPTLKSVSRQSEIQTPMTQRARVTFTRMKRTLEVIHGDIDPFPFFSA